MRTSRKRIIVDAREFVPGRFTGIGRVLCGLVDALAESNSVNEIILAAITCEAVPSRLGSRKKIDIIKVPDNFLISEKALSNLTKNNVALIISPYPKLPLFGCHCPAVHTIHDVLYLTHPAYKKQLKVYLDTLRVKMSLKRADLTWYDSSWSMEETNRLTGFAGKNARVRYLAIDERFSVEGTGDETGILKRYDLQPGYVLVLGNGLPHKNLGVLLKISGRVARKLVFVGVSKTRQACWKSRYSDANAIWIENVVDEDLPVIVSNSFCLAQPSTAEGYGYPPLEAMACGVPAVMSNIPVLIETTGGNALTADPGEPGEWVEVFEALENKETYRSQVEKGLKWVEPFRGRKGWEKHISDIEELIRGR